MTMNTMKDLQDDLMVMYSELRSGKIEAKDAIEVNNTAGKIISAAKVQLAYHALRGESPFIPFLNAHVDARRLGQDPRVEAKKTPASGALTQ